MIKVFRIVAVVAVTFAAHFCAAEEPRWSVPELLPADTLGVITLRDVPALSAKMKETALYKILNNPDVQKVFSQPLGRARGAIFGMETMLRFQTSDIASYFSQGELTFAVLGVAPQANGQPMPELMLSIQLGDKADAFVEEFNKRLDQLKAGLDGKLESTSNKLGNTTVTQLSYPQIPVKISCALCDGTFLVCTGEGRIEKLLAMREKMKAGPKIEGAPEVLAQLPAFKTAATKAGSDADLLAFVNVEAIKNNPIVNDPNRPMTPTQKFDLDMSGLRDVSAVTYSAGIKDAGVREALFVDVPAAKRKGALALLDGENADLKAFGAAPRNSILAATFKINPEQVLEKILVMREMEDPNARQNVAAVLVAVGEQLKIDPKKDIFGSLTGQGVFSVSIPAKNPKVPLAFPQPILSLQIKDKDALQRLIGALEKVGTERLDFKRIPEGDSTVTAARDKDTHQGFCYSIAGDDLLVSIYPLALRDEIHRRAAKGAKLDDDPDYAAIRAKLSGQPQTLVYVDTAAIATAAYDLLIPLAQMAGQERVPELDLAALPTADLIAQNLGGSLLDLQFQPEGIVLESYSPGGLLSLTPVAAGLGFARARQVQAMNAEQQAMIAQQNGVRPFAAARAARANRVDPKQADALGKLYADLTTFAKDHEGAFPKSLDEMKPKYLQDLGNEVEQIVYRGKQAADNFVIAHSSEKLPGNITILLQNGAIQSVARQLLGKVLQDGYTDPNAAVKPPRPPGGQDF
ncbi:MAG TPA: hypothetical protein VKX17_17655 [Planctomycetota bacterium]|nr:hypothetical protein [Planctomycetota bacterium]